MSPITEQEAAKLVCPFARAAMQAKVADEKTNCIGRACLLWQIEREPQVKKFIPSEEVMKHYIAPAAGLYSMSDLDVERGRAFGKAAVIAAADIYPGNLGVRLGGTSNRPEAFAIVEEETGRGVCGASR